MKLFKSPEEKAETAQAEEAFATFTQALSDADPDDARRLARQLETNPDVAALSDRSRRKLSEEAFLRYADAVLADDHLTEDEEDAFAAVAGALGLTQGDMEAHTDVYTKLQVAKMNDGRLPTVESPHLIAKRGEVVHFETSAALLKEVAVREFRGGSQGVSLRVAKGVRYRVGAMRGHMVTVGTQMQVADTGVLSVTSQRAAFLGNRKTLDMPYSKLIGMELFSDGVRFSLSNRQTAPLLRVSCNPDVLGALLNAAIQAAGAD